MVLPPALALHPEVVQAVVVVVATGTAVGVEVAVLIRMTETPSAAEVDRVTAGGIGIGIGIEISETGIEIATEIVTEIEIETETETGTGTVIGISTEIAIAIETATGISTDVTGSIDGMTIDVQSVTTVIARRICGRKTVLPAERKTASSADRPARRPHHPRHPVQHGLTVNLPTRLAQSKLANPRQHPVRPHGILDGILIEQTFLLLEQRPLKNHPFPVVLLHRPPRKCRPLAQFRSLRRLQQQRRRPRRPQRLHRHPPEMTRFEARPRRRCNRQQAPKPIAQKPRLFLSPGLDKTAYPTLFALRSRRPLPLPVPPPNMGRIVLRPLLPHPCLVETRVWALQNHVSMMDRRPRLLPAGRPPLRLHLDSRARSCPPSVVVDPPGRKLLLACHSPACLRALAPCSNEGFLHPGGPPRAVSNGCDRDITVDHPQLVHPLALGGSRGKRKIAMLRLLMI